MNFKRALFSLSLLLFSSSVFAVGMPWDGLLCAIVTDLRSTVAAAVAVVAIVIAGLSFAHSDADWFKLLMAVIMGIGIAAGSVVLVSMMGLNFTC